MLALSRLKALLRSARTWIILGIVAPLGMLATSGFMLLDLRQDTRERAQQTAKSLLDVLEGDIARNIELYDLSIQAAADNLRAPGINSVDPALRQLILFDRAATARDMGVMIVVDERGDIVADLDANPPRKGNVADRDYFRAHKLRAGLGLFVGQPLVSRLTGERMLPFSRRITKPDGSFGGVVMGSLKLSFFTRMFSRVDLGRASAINLYLTDGTRVIRQPYVDADIGTNIADAPTFKGFVREHSGHFVKTSVRDGVERLYTFTRVGDLPLILNVALAVDEIEAEWRKKALVIGSVVLVLCGLAVGLAILFGREMRRREAIQAELKALSVTDALTGLPNRRAFETAGRDAWDGGRQTGKPVSLLIVDADHFKRINDRYGHQVGDQVLQGLARCLASSVHRPDDFVGRIGGEEFAILLSSTDQDGAARVAAKIHAEVSSVAVAQAGIAAGAITVSIGLATVSPAGEPPLVPADLYRLADAALYEAKAAGRNRTAVSRPQDTPAGLQKRLLQVVGGGA